jgi:ubiquinone/menaquinone biosynthesis C-methylase UbiE
VWQVSCIFDIGLDYANSKQGDYDMKNNREVWNRIALRHHPCFFCSRKQEQQLLRLMKHTLLKNMTVLELACGTGQLAISAAPSVRHYEATDYSVNMIDQAKKKLHSSRLYFSVQDAVDLPYEDEMFDAVIISNALNTIRDSDQVLSNIWRVLKKDGLLIAPTFTAAGNVSGSVIADILKLSGYPIAHTWTPQSYLDFLKNHGFDIVQSRIVDGICKMTYAEAKKARINN